MVSVFLTLTKSTEKCVRRNVNNAIHVNLMENQTEAYKIVK